MDGCPDFRAYFYGDSHDNQKVGSSRKDKRENCSQKEWPAYYQQPFLVFGTDCFAHTIIPQIPFQPEDGAGFFNYKEVLRQPSFFAT